MTVGVVLSTSTIPGAGTSQRVAGSGYIVAGLTQRGNPTQPVKVRSMQQYVQLFGAEVTFGFLYNDLAQFFGEGGDYAWVCRTVGTAPVAGTVTLNDTAVTPLPTLKLTAGCPSIDPISGSNTGNVPDPGSWSATLTVQIVASVLAGNFDVVVAQSGAQVERWGPFPTVAAAG